MRHRQVDAAGADTLRPRARPPEEPDGRFRPPDDLDLLPGEANAGPEGLADRLLAGESSRVVLRGIRPRVAVRSLGLGKAALAEAGPALERCGDAVDLDEIHADAQHLVGVLLQPL